MIGNLLYREDKDGNNEIDITKLLIGIAAIITSLYVITFSGSNPLQMAVLVLLTAVALYYLHGMQPRRMEAIAIVLLLQLAVASQSDIFQLSLFMLLTLIAILIMHDITSRKEETVSEVLESAKVDVPIDEIRETHQKAGSKYSLSEDRLYELAGIDEQDTRIKIVGIEHTPGNRKLFVDLNVRIRQKEGIVLPKINAEWVHHQEVIDIRNFERLFDNKRGVICIEQSDKFLSGYSIVTDENFAINMKWMDNTFEGWDWAKDRHQSTTPLHFSSFKLEKYCSENPRSTKPFVDCRRKWLHGDTDEIENFDYRVIIGFRPPKTVGVSMYDGPFFNRIRLMAEEVNVDFEEVIRRFTSEKVEFSELSAAYKNIE